MGSFADVLIGLVISLIVLCCLTSSSVGLFIIAGNNPSNPPNSPDPSNPPNINPPKSDQNQQSPENTSQQPTQQSQAQQPTQQPQQQAQQQSTLSKISDLNELIGKQFMINASSINKCINHNNTTTYGFPLSLKDCNNNKEQLFTVQGSDANSFISNSNQMCIDDGDSRNMIMWGCDKNNKNQQWRMRSTANGGTNIINPNKGLCITVIDENSIKPSYCDESNNKQLFTIYNVN